MPSSNAVLRRWLAAAAAGAVLVISPLGIAASHPAAAGTVTVKVKVAGQSRGAVAGTHPEDGKDQIPARNACTRFTAPKFAVPGRPLAYNVSFGNPDVLNFRPGIFFAFYYDPKQVGRPQKLYTRGAAPTSCSWWRETRLRRRPAGMGWDGDARGRPAQRELFDHGRPRHHRQREGDRHGKLALLVGVRASDVAA